jgi:hypothetical protein
MNRSKSNDSRFWRRCAAAGAIGTIITTSHVCDDKLALGALPQSIIGKAILVWHSNQKVPATLYGNVNFGPGNYSILVCQDPNSQLELLGSDKAIIYHFN